jgi:proteasome activator subunit 4
VFFYRNLLSISSAQARVIMDALLDCLADENVEVREMASKALSGVVRCSQRQSIVPLKVRSALRPGARATNSHDPQNRFVALARKSRLPARRDAGYADALKALHSAILGLCALIESYPYTVETWMPPLTDSAYPARICRGWMLTATHTVLATHATDPPPISTTIRKCASEFKKTHQDTWHKDQAAFDEDQLQNLSTMLVGTSYCASCFLSPGLCVRALTT